MNRPQPQYEARKTSTVVCERHGLRYNPESQSGCVRCRKEAGERIGTTAPRAAVRAGVVRASASSESGSLAAALAVAFLLIAISSALLYLEHKATWDDVMETRTEGLNPEQQEQMQQIFEQDP